MILSGWRKQATGFAAAPTKNCCDNGSKEHLMFPLIIYPFNLVQFHGLLSWGPHMDCNLVGVVVEFGVFFL